MRTLGAGRDDRLVRGFSLVELLVALAIAAVLLVAAVHTAAEGARRTGHLKQQSVAHWVARNQAAALELSPRWPPPAHTAGEVSMAKRRWRWTARVADAGHPAVRSLRLTVWATGSAEPVYTLTTVIAHAR